MSRCQEGTDLVGRVSMMHLELNFDLDIFQRDKWCRVTMKSGECGIVFKKFSGWTILTDGRSVVVLMLRFPGGTYAAVGRLMCWFGTFDAKEALIEVAVESW